MLKFSRNKVSGQKKFIFLLKKLSYLRHAKVKSLHLRWFSSSSSTSIFCYLKKSKILVSTAESTRTFLKDFLKDFDFFLAVLYLFSKHSIWESWYFLLSKKKFTNKISQILARLLRICRKLISWHYCIQRKLSILLKLLLAMMFRHLHLSLLFHSTLYSCTTKTTSQYPETDLWRFTSFGSETTTSFWCTFFLLHEMTLVLGHLFLYLEFLYRKGQILKYEFEGIWNILFLF